jgi:trehalose 6-phosphate phosphatase
MARFLFDCLDALRQRIENAGRLLLFLDFDGTLAPIVECPEDAGLPAETLLLLQTLTRDPAFLVSLISGRAVKDLRARIALEGVIYAGNHGLEIRGPGFEFEEPGATAVRPALRALLSTLGIRLSALQGVEIEDKNLSASVHFRRAASLGGAQARDAVFAALDELVDRNLFRLREGKMVGEILPRIDADKGTAVRRIRSLRGSEGDLTICAGDDTTDEDLFAAADGGVAVRVGEAPATTADYFVNGTEELREFLMWLRGVKDRKSGP